MEFHEEYYEHCKYEKCCSAIELEQGIIKEDYNEQFDVRIFINSCIESLKKDTRLIIDKKQNKKKKIYRIISTISFCIPSAVIVPLVIYALIVKQPIQLGGWLVLVILIPLIVWFIFDIKSIK